MIEVLSDYDDEIAELFLESLELPISLLKKVIREQTINGALVPVLCGSAFKNKGIQPLLDSVGDCLHLLWIEERYLVFHLRICQR